MDIYNLLNFLILTINTQTLFLHPKFSKKRTTFAEVTLTNRMDPSMADDRPSFKRSMIQAENEVEREEGRGGCGVGGIEKEEEKVDEVEEERFIGWTDTY